MPAARRVEPPADLPDDLAQLRAAYLGLPNTSVKFDTRQGRPVILRVRYLRENGIYTAPQIAEALGVSDQTVYNWLKQHLRKTTIPYPTPEETRDLRAALRLAGTQDISRKTRSYAQVHRHLQVLLQAGYALPDIASAAEISSRRLRKYEQPPLPNPAQISANVRQSLPSQRSSRTRTLRQGR